ncbi:MAG: GTPase-activating protein [Desulfuromonas sp.]|nr:MAG: GTPase-activating protein [Desulfuromonas sp.]
MILLPRGNPVREKVNPGKINLPEALGKLQKGSFTGYLRFEAANGTGVIIFSSGKLISALYEEGSERLIAYDAIARIFELSLAGRMTLDIYKLSTELAMSIHALLHGDTLYKGQELKLIDIKSLLGKFKADKMSGCLRIYTDEKIALIFYKDGTPLGFFHDGSTDIETSADASMSVAKLPGAKIDVLSSGGADDIELADLMASADLSALWKKAQELLVKDKQSKQKVESRNREMAQKQRRIQLQSMLRTTAEKHIGRIGVQLVDKEMERHIPEEADWNEALLDKLLSDLSKAAKMVAGPKAIKAMLGEMQKSAKAIA